MKRLTMIMLLLCACGLAGCQNGDLKISGVVEGQAAPHAGYNIGPDIYVKPGEPVPVSGVVVWIKGLDPNDLLGE